MIQQNDIIDTKHLTTSETDTINYGKTNSLEKGHPPSHMVSGRIWSK